LKRVNLTLIIICISALAGFQTPAQSFHIENDSVLEDIFQGDGTLNLSLYANFDSIIEDASVLRSVNRSARLQINSNNRINEFVPVQIETRGNFRMKPENCNFPPLKLNFNKDNSIRTIFLKNNSVKLVSQCQLFKPNYQAYLLQEYLIYKIYSMLSKYSFRVRLLKISYINKGFLFDTITRYSFAVEPPKELARRYKAKRVNSNNVAVSEIDLWNYKLVCFFEYMIMNNDWSIAICHNIELIQPDPGKLPIPVPFDFDWSGIVKVPYEVPTSAGIKVIQPERSFKGDFKSRRQLKDMIQFFNSKRGEIYSLVSQFSELDSSYRISFLKTVDDYFAILNSYFTFNKKIIHKQ
jgi:hypothetical protein